LSASETKKPQRLSMKASEQGEQPQHLPTSAVKTQQAQRANQKPYKSKNSQHPYP